MCEFCKDKVHYKTAYGDIWIDNDVLWGVCLHVTFDKCPPYSDCCAKDTNVTEVFEVKFCPMCGEKLR